MPIGGRCASRLPSQIRVWLSAGLCSLNKKFYLVRSIALSLGIDFATGTLVRHLQLEDFLPRDRPATFADLEHLRQTLSLIRRSQGQFFETSATGMPRPAEDFDLAETDPAAAASAQPAWTPTSDRSGPVERAPEQSREAWIRWLLKQDREQPVQRQFIEGWRARGC